MLDWETKQLLHLLILAHLREPKQALYQVQTFPATRYRQSALNHNTIITCYGKII